MANIKFVFIITHSHDRPDEVAGALQIAANMRAFDTEVDFFLMNEGALLGKKGYADTLLGQSKGQFSPIHELLKTHLEDFEAKFYVCEACAKYYELTEDVLIDNAEIKTGSFLGEMLLERQGLTF
jgi:predicted peroxiredoxin